MINQLTITISIIFLLIASYTDFKKREVPDWLNFIVLAIGFGISFIYSAIYLDWSYILSSIIGFVVFLAIGYLMFYSGQWGGGDSKALIALGALIGINFDFSKIPWLGDFFINLLVIGAFYGLIWSVFLAFKNKKYFLKQFSLLKSKKAFSIARLLVLIAIFGLLISLFLLKIPLYIYAVLIVSISLYGLLYLWVFIKAVEGSSMLKIISPRKLTEGDWISEDIIVKGKRICGPKDLGVSKEQIKKLIQLKIKKVLIKEGIPFIPSFFIAFVVTVLYGNLIFLLFL